MCRTVKNHNPLFIVLGGDIAYAINGNPFRLRSSAMNQWFSFLKEWSELMMGQDGRIIPFLIVAGNHDLAPEESDLFFDLFAFPERKLYRTIDFGDYLSLFLLDSAIFDPIEGEQTDWLDQALAARTQVLGRFAIYHKSAYPCVYPYDGAIPQKIRAHWCPLFDKYELPIAFENHNHAFKRTFPIRDNRVDPSGVVYLGDGCWGAMPRKPRKDWYSAKAENKNHVYLIELEKESAKIQAVGLQGEQIDSLNLNFTKKTRS
jgi:3',5'-cyclic AMP phosphodiesterase CpdA